MYGVKVLRKIPLEKKKYFKIKNLIHFDFQVNTKAHFFLINTIFCLSFCFTKYLLDYKTVTN